MWRNKRSQGERGVFGEKGETTPSKPVVCDLCERREDSKLGQNMVWTKGADLCEALAETPKVAIKCAWLHLQSHLIFIPTLKGRYYYLNFVGEEIVAQGIEMTGKGQDEEFDSRSSDPNGSIHVLPTPTFHRVFFVINRKCFMAGLKVSL